MPPDTRSGRAELFRGAFSSQVSAMVGFGATRRKRKQTITVYAEEQPDGTFRLRTLNEHAVPSGPAKICSREELLADYLPEPGLYLNKVAPQLREVERTVDTADAHRQRGELMSAEFEYHNALRVDEEHIRATFGLGLTYLERGENDSAHVVFRRLLSLDAAFGPEHKHLFNEFGIKMRKCGMYRQALCYYFRAYRLAHDDEHLLYNIARTYFERKKYKLSRKFLEMALAQRPDLKVARDLGRVLQKVTAPSESEAPVGPDFCRLPGFRLDGGGKKARGLAKKFRGWAP